MAYNISRNKCKMEGENGTEREREREKEIWREIYYRQHTLKSHKALTHTRTDGNAPTHRHVTH